MRNSVSTDEELAVNELYFVLSHSKFPSTHLKGYYYIYTLIHHLSPFSSKGKAQIHGMSYR